MSVVQGPRDPRGEMGTLEREPTLKDPEQQRLAKEAREEEHAAHPSLCVG